MKISQKSFVSVILIVIIVVLVAIAGYFVFVKKSAPNTNQQIFNNVTTNWKVYTNEKYHFTLRMPENLVAITQNDNQNLSDFLFIDQNDLKNIEKDPLFKTNPFLAALNNNISGLHLYRNSSSWVGNAKESDIKFYLSAPAGSPNGNVEVTLKDFTQATANNGQTIYLYIQELKTTPATQDIGTLWINRGVVYTLTNLSRDNLPSKEMLYMIAESFTEIK